MSAISPKLTPVLVLAIIAAIVLAVVYGDSSYLLLILLGFAQTGVAALRSPSPDVTQKEVDALGAIKRGELPRTVNHETAAKVHRTVAAVVRHRNRA